MQVAWRVVAEYLVRILIDMAVQMEADPLDAAPISPWDGGRRRC